MESILELFTEELPITYRDYKEGLFVIYWADTGHYYISSSKSIYAASASQQSLLVNDRHTNVNLQNKYNANKNFIVRCLFTSNKARVAEIIKYYKNNKLSFNNLPMVSRVRPQILLSVTLKPVPYAQICYRQKRPTINDGVIYKSVKALSIFLKLGSSGTIHRLMSKHYPDCNYLDVVQPQYIKKYGPK